MIALRRRVRPRSASTGFSLVELMVALVIGSVLIIGAVYVHSQSRSTFRVNENVARLQEQARFVIAMIEPDLELAGYYGFTNSPQTVRLVRGGNPDIVVAPATRMRQVSVRAGDSVPVAVPDLPASAHACGVNFAVDVLTAVQGSNDAYALGRDPAASCDAYGAGPQARTDTLTIRRVATRTSAPEAGRLQVYASRLSSRTSQLLFADGLVPGVVNDDNRIHDLVVRTYYVSQDSVDRPGVPALRVKSLTRVGGEVSFVDDEVMPGVEDLQVQFGIDTGDYDNDGILDPGVDANGDGVPETDGRATRYVDPDFPGLERFQVVAVRFWIRVRADEREAGLVDGRTYRYANVRYTPAGDDRSFRRAVMSRTVALRNARLL